MLFDFDLVIILICALVLCYSATLCCWTSNHWPTVGTWMCGCMHCVRFSFLSPNLYIIPQWRHPQGPEWLEPALEGQSLKWDFSTTDPCSGPLTFCQENRNDLWPWDLWAATIFLQVVTPQLQPTMPKPGRQSEEVRPWCVEDHRGVKWRVHFQKRDVQFFFFFFFERTLSLTKLVELHTWVAN